MTREQLIELARQRDAKCPEPKCGKPIRIAPVGGKRGAVPGVAWEVEESVHHDPPECDWFVSVMRP